MTTTIITIAIILAISYAVVDRMISASDNIKRLRTEIEDLETEVEQVKEDRDKWKRISDMKQKDLTRLWNSVQRKAKENTGLDLIIQVRDSRGRFVKRNK